LFSVVHSMAIMLESGYNGIVYYDNLMRYFN
jgi:hypothetical protein